MAGPELKSTSSSTLRDTKQMGEKFMEEASPRMREAIDQVSDAASGIYQKARGWLGEGNNKNYSFIALAAAAGVIGFVIGRNLSSPTRE